LTLQRHRAWPLERPRWRSHAGAWERATNRCEKDPSLRSRDDNFARIRV